jgi:hypothetical protein
MKIIIISKKNLINFLKINNYSFLSMWKLTLGYSIFLHGEIFHFPLEGSEPLGQDFL